MIKTLLMGSVFTVIEISLSSKEQNKSKLQKQRSNILLDITIEMT